MYMIEIREENTKYELDYQKRKKKKLKYFCVSLYYSILWKVQNKVDLSRTLLPYFDKGFHHRINC